MNLWNGPSLGLVCFSTALCCAEEVLLIYYYYYAWNESKGSDSISIKPKVAFLSSWIEELLSSCGILPVPGQWLPVHCWAVPRSFPGLPGQCNEETGGSFLLKGDTGGVSSGNCSCSDNSHARLLETPLLGLQNGLVTGDSGATCKEFLREPMPFPKFVLSTGNELVVPLCFCAARKEPGSSLAGAAAD